MANANNNPFTFFVDLAASSLPVSEKKYKYIELSHYYTSNRNHGEYASSIFSVEESSDEIVSSFVSKFILARVPQYGSPLFILVIIEFPIKQMFFIREKVKVTWLFAFMYSNVLGKKKFSAILSSCF